MKRFSPPNSRLTFSRLLKPSISIFLITRSPPGDCIPKAPGGGDSEAGRAARNPVAVVDGPAVRSVVVGFQPAAVGSRSIAVGFRSV